MYRKKQDINKNESLKHQIEIELDAEKKVMKRLLEGRVSACCKFKIGKNRYDFNF